MFNSLRPRSWTYPVVGGIALLLAVAPASWVLAGCSSSRGGAEAAGVSTTTPAAPHGPFAVGRRSVTFVDPSRTTPANGSIAAKPVRTLETVVEYPAAGVPDPAHEATGVPPLGGFFPVVISVHGFGAHAVNPYLHYWAAAGFIAVAPKFPLTNTDTPGGPNAVDAGNEPGDISFIINRLWHLPTADADLQPVIDAANVGLFGESFGAGVVMQAGMDESVRDASVKAVVAVAGSCASCMRHNTVAVPLMLIQGDADPVVPYRQTARTFADASSPKYFLTLIGAQHVQFGPPWEPIAARASIDFFARYLGHDRAALVRLPGDASVTGTTRFEAG